MQDYLLDLSGKNLYTLYVAARRKLYFPEKPETVQDRLVRAGAADAPVADMLPDLSRLAAFSEDFELFRARWAEVVERVLALEPESGDPGEEL